MVPELGANRLAFMPAVSVTAQYSRDGGSTWIDYGASSSQKINLFNGIGSSFHIGKNTSTGVNYTNYQLRLILNTASGVGNLYTVLNKFVILVSTSGSSGS
jgi:outer membrane protein TolC